jgi:uncharacterized protein YbaR (Trm112 family)
MRNDLESLQKMYGKGVNIMEFLRQEMKSGINTPDIIKIGYDLQAGSYVQNELEHPEWEDVFAVEFAKVINSLPECQSILEFGVGEGTKLFNVLTRLNKVPPQVYGFDISFSRLRCGVNFLKNNNTKATLFLSNLFNASLQDNSVDIVYTSHSLEPNGGKEKEALAELYRVTRRYLVLFEPIYEMANEAAKRHIEKHGYVRNLHATALELGYKVIEYRSIFESNMTTPNNTGVIIIEKKAEGQAPANPLACPVTKAPVQMVRNNYFCKESLLVYPVIDEIPCLLPENAIIATHYMDDLVNLGRR